MMEAGAAPLSFAQERLWLLHELGPVGAAYNVPMALRLKGTLNRGALRDALDGLIERHPVFRTRFVRDSGTAVQVVEEPYPCALSEVDLSVGHLNAAEVLDELLARETRQCFEFSAGRILRCCLFRLAAEEHVLLIVTHHIITDGWSGEVLLNDLLSLYQANDTGRSARLEPLTWQFSDYASWHRAWMEKPERKRQLAYWLERLRGAPDVLRIPTDFPRPAAASFRGRHLRVVLPAQTMRLVRQACIQFRCTAFMIYMAVFQTLLWRWTGQSDLLVGAPASGRRLKKTQHLIGFFANTLVFRATFDVERRWCDFLQEVRDRAAEAYANQDLSFAQVVQGLLPARDLARSPLIQVFFSYAKAPTSQWCLPGLSVSVVAVKKSTAQFDLSLQILDKGEEVEAWFEYATDLFEEATIARMGGHYVRLLEQVLENPQARLRDLSVLTDAERRQLQSWNATAMPWVWQGGVHELIGERARRQGADVAVLYEQERLSYRELDARANQLAHYLRDRGVGPEEVVGLCMERSLEMVVGILGVLKAGGAYLPLDPEYPLQRLSYMRRDAGARVLLTQSRHIALYEAQELAWGEVIVLDEHWPRIAGCEADGLPVETQRGQLAYVIYTSGSTGQPKGVMITHEALCNRLYWMQAQYALESGEAVLQKTPFSFDVSVWEFFWPLLQGGVLVMARPGGHTDPQYLAETIERHAITTIHFVPSMLQAFLEWPGVLPRSRGLRRVIVSGEVLPVTLARRFVRALPARLHNLYGPTEATVDVSSYAVPAEGELESVPIGRPIWNTELHVLDEQLQPVPVGVTGELYIGGMGLARGYLNRAALTAERFIANPFGPAGSRLYRTGDLARYRADGELEYLGRTDHQVKLRGFRIEQGEIEATLLGDPRVRQAAVVVRQWGGEPHLVGYVSGVEEAELESLRGRLGEKLPPYMIPSRLVALPELPLTASGKVDRRALPAAEPVLTESYTPPGSPLEAALVRIWSELLGLERIGVTDNFFECGGDSIRAVIAVARMKEYLADLELLDFFRAPTIAQLCAATLRASA
jgi:amino acid adenylation domain-containing protein